MEVFRLSKEAFVHSLSGIGAALKGARWNSMGIEIVYTAANRSLAMAEVAVHFSVAMAPPKYQMATIHLPDDIPMMGIPIVDLPTDWSVFPHSETTKKFGDRFILENRYCILKVPSAVTKGDFNYLLNPRHPEFARIRIIETSPFVFDGRLWR
jgi:RES domain-containing protein